jgi:hypothetical protein
VKSITGVGQQNSNISAAFSNQPNIAIPSQQIGAPKQPQANGLGGQVGTGSMTKPTVKPSTKAPAKPVKKMIPVSGPNANFQETPDPRDSVYWQNAQAIEATLGPGGTEMISLLAEQQQAKRAFDTDIDRQVEYNRRRARDLAEARLGTGSAYSGMARRAQRENAQDFMADIGNRQSAFSDANYNRNIRRQDVENRYLSALRQEEAAGTSRVYDNMMEQANESGGDRTFTPDDPNASFRRQVKGTTKRIKGLRAKLEDTTSDKQRARIEKRLDRLRKRRSKLQGKISGNS